MEKTTAVSNARKEPSQSSGYLEFAKDAEIVGILSKKRIDREGLEDPYKTKVQCWLKTGHFYLLSLAPDLSPLHGAKVISLDITRCKVIHTRPNVDFWVLPAIVWICLV